MVLDARKMSIVTMLLKQSEFTNIAMIAKTLGVSNRSIRYDLEGIDQWLAIHSFPSLSKVPHKGILLKVTGQEIQSIKEKLGQKAGELCSISPEKRREIILYYLLSAGQMVRLDKIAKKTYVSKTTVSNDLDGVASWLEKFNLQLIRKRGCGVTVAGGEEDHRQALIVILHQLARVNHQDFFSQSIETYIAALTKWFPKTNLSFIKKEIESSQELLGIKFSHDGFISLLSHIALAIERIFQHKDIGMKKSQLVDLMTKEEFQIAKDLAHNLEKPLGVTIPLEEVGYITLHLMSAKINQVVNPGNYFEKNQVLMRVIDDMINKVESLLNIELVNRHAVQRALYIHILPSIQRLKNEQSFSNPILPDIRNKYSTIFEACREAAKFLEMEFNIQSNEDDITYLTMHFAAALEMQQDRRDKISNVLLVCASGIGTSRLLWARLKTCFQSLNIIDTVSFEELDKHLQQDKVDLVISTIQLGLINKPYVVVTPLLTEEDQKKLSQYLQVNNSTTSVCVSQSTIVIELIETIAKHCTIDNFAGLQTDLINFTNNVNKFFQPRQAFSFSQDMLPEHHIQVGISCSTWQEAIRRSAVSLLLGGFISEAYVENIIQRIHKYGPYMVIAPGIALPHAGSSDGVYRNGLAIMTLKEPVPFNHPSNDPVHTILMLAATNKHDHMETLSHILEVLAVADNVRIINKATVPGTIYELLQAVRR